LIKQENKKYKKDEFGRDVLDENERSSNSKTLGGVYLESAQTPPPADPFRPEVCTIND
jgi:hypothetical protein